MNVAVVGQAVGLFVVTNIDDLLVLALFFGQAAATHTSAWKVVAGQSLGFAAILVLAVAGALGAGLLPEQAIAYLGLVPLALGIRAARQGWRHRGDSDADADSPASRAGPTIVSVAAVCLANGGDNIGVYVPVFATSSTAGMVTYVAVFLVMLALWCAAGHYFANRPIIARALARWGHLILPIVLIAIGVLILLEGHAFGL